MNGRQYHWLYFLLGFMIAVIVATLMGCEQPQTSGGVECYQCPPPPPVCCAAMMPECMACKEGISEDEWIEDTCGPNAISVEYSHWDEINNEPVWMCEALIID